MQKAAREFGWKAGIAFQLADDVLDLFAEEAKLGKKLGKDIYEHKLGNVVLLQALPLLSQADRDYVLQVLRSDKPTENDVMKVIALLKQTTASDIVQKKAKQLVNEAKNALDSFPNKEATQLLETLVDFIYQRSF